MRAWVKEWFTRRGADFAPADLVPACLAALLWLRLLNVPVVPHGAHVDMLDWSWQYCNAYFLKHALQAGVEYIFPTTLLGYFYTRVYDPALFGWYWACQLALNGLAAYNLLRLARSYQTRRVQAGFLLACLLVMTLNPALQMDIAYYLTLVTIGQVIVSSDSKPARLWINLFALALLCCMKFTFLLTGVCIVICAIPLHKRAGQAWYVHPAGVLVVLFLGFWLLLKQPLGNLPLYFKNMLTVSLGYNGAMGFASKLDLTFVGLAVLLLCLLALWRMQRRAPDRNLPACALLVLLLAELWKNGFVRADGHMLIFFGCMSLIPLLLPVYFGAYRPVPRGSAGLLAGCALLSFFCFLLINGSKIARAFLADLLHHPLPAARMALLPFRVGGELDAQYTQERARWRLPAIDARVGKAAIDVISVSQFAVLFNDLNYRPRPVYQSYSAFTPGLRAINGDFYRSPDAPAYVLLDLNTIDNRWLMHDDSDAIRELWRRYRPVLAEKEFVLLERQAETDTAGGAPGTKPRPLSDVSNKSQAAAPAGTKRFSVDFGTEIPITDSNAWHLLSVRMRPTLAGKLRDLAIRPVPIAIEARLDDGTQVRRRLIPAMAQSDFLLDPCVENTDDFVHLYEGRTGRRVRSFRIVVDFSHPGVWMQNPIEVSVTSCRPLD